MGEWEEMFGEGVASEDVVARINSALTNERDQEAKLYKSHMRDQLTAYRGSKDIKKEFMSHLENKMNCIADADVENGLIQYIYKDIDAFDELDRLYSIPTGLSYFIDEITREMSYNRDKSASKWIMQLFLSIEPGADLRLISYKFAANLARSVAGFPTRSLSNEVIRLCQPALGISYAQARGVLVQKDIAAIASSCLWRAVSDQFDGGQYNSESVDDFVCAIVASSIENTGRKIAKAFTYSVGYRCQTRAYGDAELDRCCNLVAEELMFLVENAPKARIKIVDLDLITASVCV